MDSGPRRVWQAIEPLHAIVYFAPEPAEAATAVGLRGWWMGYFAGRVAPLGPVGPEAVAAVTYGFAPAMVARAIPDAWSLASPADVIATRLAAVAVALERRLDTTGLAALAELADVLGDAIGGCRYEGRPLAAAWSAVPRPASAAAAAWLGTAVLREQRGDGHVIAAVAAGLSGLEAAITHVATGATTRASIQPSRGWTDADWEGAEASLRTRGLLAADGTLTGDGASLRHRVESMTDDLAMGPVERIGAAGVDRIVSLAAPVSRHLIDTGVIPVPNPIGVGRP